MNLKKKCRCWDFLSDLLISVKKKKIKKILGVFCLMLCMKLHLCMIYSDKTLVWGKRGEGMNTVLETRVLSVTNGQV